MRVTASLRRGKRALRVLRSPQCADECSLAARRVVLLYAYLSFALSESMHLSGIVAVLTAGIIMNHYAQKNLSEKARPFVKNLLVSISKMADSIIFFLVGLNIVLFSTAFNAEFSFLVFGLCLIGRFCNIAPLTCCVNRFRKDKIPSNFAYIAWHSGLRGAIAYAISIEFPSQHRATIINATSFISESSATISCHAVATLTRASCLVGSLDHGVRVRRLDDRRHQEARRALQRGDDGGRPQGRALRERRGERHQAQDRSLEPGAVALDRARLRQSGVLRPRGRRERHHLGG